MVEHDGTSHQPLDCILSPTVIEVPVTEKLGFLSSTAKRLIPLASLASPIIFNAMIREITELSTIIFVGRCGDVVLIGAATLGNMMCNITGFSLAYGLCCALDTLISQAYGAKSYRLTGLYAQRAAIILTLSSIPVALMWSQTHIILRYGLGIPPDTAKLAGAWARTLTLGLWPTLMVAVLSKWLQGQCVVWPVVISSIASAIFNITCNLILMRQGFGFEGVSLAYALTQWFGFLILCGMIIVRKMILKSQKKRFQWILKLTNKIREEKPSGNYSVLPSSSDHDVMLTVGAKTAYEEAENGQKRVPSKSGKDRYAIEIAADNVTHGGKEGGYDDCNAAEEDCEDNWPAFSPEIFEGWWEFLRLGIPGALSLLLEWGSFELAASIAARLGPVPLAVHGIYASTAGIFYIIPQAVAFATATLAGNSLGAAKPEEAARVVLDGIYADFFYGVFAGLVLLIVFRPRWGSIYSTDQEVQELVYSAMPVMFLYLVVDSTKCVTLNILRSTGRPQITVWGNLVSCLAIMLPLGWVLAVKMSYGLTGLWLAMSFAWLVSTIVYLAVVLKTDWSEQTIVKKAVKNTELNSN